jgi:dephospho-CoA kinase
MILLGLTGSIGMGKTTTAAMFAQEGAPVWDADAAVHALYGPGGAAVAPIEAAFPGVAASGEVDRAALSARLVEDPAAFRRLEAIVHPMVSADRQAFVARARASGARVAVIDVPLLFEGGGHREVDAVVVVTADPASQRRRVLDRPGMTEERLDSLLARQTPDADKRSRADFVVDTGAGLDAARDQVRLILATVGDPAFRPKAKLEGPGEPHH